MAKASMMRSDHGNMVNLEIEQLKPPSWRLRLLIEEDISELARSVQNMGLLQPVVVHRTNDDYQVVFRNHRIEPCRRRTHIRCGESMDENKN